jgi:hypothetical protein
LIVQYLILIISSHFPQGFLVPIDYAMNEGQRVKPPLTPGGHKDRLHNGKGLGGKAGWLRDDRQGRCGETSLIPTWSVAHSKPARVLRRAAY